MYQRFITVQLLLCCLRVLLIVSPKLNSISRGTQEYLVLLVLQVRDVVIIVVGCEACDGDDVMIGLLTLTTLTLTLRMEPYRL